MMNVERGNAGMMLSNAVADAVERTAAATVMVRARRRLPSSGVICDHNMVLTANHTVEREEDIQVELPDGQVIGASLAGRDQGTDLAVLRLGRETALAPASLARPESTRVGSLVVAVGRPSSNGIQASFGVLTAIGGGLRAHRGGSPGHFLVTDVVPLPGFSGGPLVNLAGEVMGINTSGLVRSAAIAIPADAAWEVAKNLAEHGRVRRGYLGVRSQMVELPDQALGRLREVGLGREHPTGLLLVGIESGGPSAGGELMVGDILVGLGGRSVADHDDLSAGLVGIEIDQPIEVHILRGGELKNVQVQVGDRKE